MNKIFIVVTVLLLSGCASNRYSVTLDSEPRNAAVTCNGTMIGYTPITKDIDGSKTTGSQSSIPSCQATWVSGAVQSYPSVIDTIRYPNGITLTVRRSTGGSDYTQDAQAAMYGAQQRENDRQRQNQQNQQEMQNIQQQLGNIGRTINTNCYKVGNQVFCNTY